MTTTKSTHSGIDLDAISFDQNGQADGIDDDLLDDISGGLMDSDPNHGCDPNANCCCK